MDTQRLILFVVFSFSLLMLWEAWQKEHRPQAQLSVVPTNIPAPGSTPTPAPANTVAQGAIAIPEAEPAQASQHEILHVRTDTVVAQIDTQGGNLVYLELLKHKDVLDSKKNLVLLGPDHKYAAQSGFIGQGLPNHKTLFSSTKKEFDLSAGQDKVDVTLEAVAAGGIKVIKTFTFHRDSYRIDIVEEITNGGMTPLATHAYFQLTRDDRAPAGDPDMVQTFTGAAIYTAQDKFQKVAFSDIEKGKTSHSKGADNGWIALVQHYFVAALLPQDKTQREFYTRKVGEKLFSVGVILPVGPIAPGAKAAVNIPLYAGPQDQDHLKAIAPGLDLVVDYGWLTVIAAPLFWALKLFHGWAGNWGLAIILLTVVIKLIFFPLSAASYRSMAKMKLVTPKMMKIREQYADDKAKQNQAMMDLYKTEKINPLGGCLPILVQIPVFIALYWVLLASVELRHASWFWVHDLAAPDMMFAIPGINMPIGILPIVMMISMIFQTKMNPTPPDPVQAKVMMVMPFAFGIMFFFFPAGLVLYWVVNNILSILQQWQITRLIGEGKSAAGAKR